MKTIIACVYEGFHYLITNKEELEMLFDDASDGVNEFGFDDDGNCEYILVEPSTEQEELSLLIPTFDLLFCGDKSEAF